MVFGETVNILDLVDQGLGHALSGSFGGVDRDRCIRRNCKRACVNDSGFCAECHAWMTGRTRTDPLSQTTSDLLPPPWSGQYPPTSDTEWSTYLDVTGRRS